MEHSLKIRKRKKWPLVQSLWATDLFHLTFAFGVQVLPVGFISRISSL